MALSFTSTDRVTIPTSSSISNLAAMTYIAWVYPNSSFSNGKAISSRTTNLGGVRQLGLIDALGNFEMRVRRTTSACAYQTTGGPLQLNSWNFMAGTFDQSAAAGNTSHVYTGLLTTIATEVSYGLQQDGSGSADSDVGDLYIGNTTASAQPFPGNIAFFAVWNRVLSAGEIRQQQFDPRATSGCVLFTHLGFAGNTSVIDWSGQHNNSSAVSGTSVTPHVPLGPLFNVQPLLYRNLASVGLDSWFAQASTPVREKHSINSY